MKQTSELTEKKLCPAQQRATDWILGNYGLVPVLHLRSGEGDGRTTVLKAVHRQLGGAFLSIADFVEASRPLPPLALEEAVLQPLLAALRGNDVVIVDDLDLAANVMAPGCGNYPRAGWFSACMSALAAYIEATNKVLILGSSWRGIPSPLDVRSLCHEIADFEPDDYRALCEVFFERAVDEIDFAKVHRYAPRLNTYQLRNASVRLRNLENLETEQFIDYLRTQQLASNVALGEVAQVDLKSLHGVDEVIRSLEANVVLPLENDNLAQQLDLRPKRGILLVGPPGTGKTTVGRALAHRLRGKFFLVDGTMISGTDDFYSDIHRIFQAAKENAPSVIFIDDSDVIFESGEEHGLYRYLLTMLDGLESKSVGRVCVMMTAMDVSNLPPALVRSGRIELWLETKLPDPRGRMAILRDILVKFPPALQDVDLEELVAATEGFTGADLKRTTEDGKILYAFDVARELPTRRITDYFLAGAAETYRNKERYATAEGRTKGVDSARPAWFTRVPHDVLAQEP